VYHQSQPVVSTFSSCRVCTNRTYARNYGCRGVLSFLFHGAFSCSLRAIFVVFFLGGLVFVYFCLLVRGGGGEIFFVSCNRSLARSRRVFQRVGLPRFARHARFARLPRVLRLCRLRRGF